MALTAADLNVLDELAEYDYFETKRNAHLASLKKIKQEETARSREAVKAKSLSWRKNGDAALGSVQGCVANLKAILMPHNYLKFALEQLRQHNNKLKEQAKIRSLWAPRQYANRLCVDINPYSRKKLHIKTNVAMQKVNVMHDVCLHYILKHPLRTDEYQPPSHNWRTFRNLFRTYMRFVPADPEVIASLKRKRAHLRKVKAKLDLILSTLEKCRNIRVCKSAQHTNPAGCSACGVMYRGGTLNGEEYVASYSRDTGLPQLVTLEFEFETLYKEEEIQVEIIRKVREDLEAFERDIFPVVTLNIQYWWIFVLCFKRVSKPLPGYRKSSYRYRIRRLVVMKRELDLLIKEAAPIDMERMSDKHCDQIPALVEYVDLITSRKKARMDRMIALFHSKLRNICQLVRYKRSLIKPPTPVVYERPIIFKSAPLMDRKQYICFRAECKLRKFLTEDRYNTHMSIHKKEDLQRYEVWEQHKQKGAERKRKEKDMLQRIRQSREHLSGAGVGASAGAAGTAAHNKEKHGNKASAGGDDAEGEDELDAAHALVDYSFDDNYELITPDPVYLEVQISKSNTENNTEDGTYDDTATEGGTATGGTNTGNNTARSGRSDGSKLSSLLSAGFDFEARVGSQVLQREEKVKVNHPKLLIPSSEDHYPDTVSPSSLQWTSNIARHVYHVNGEWNSALYSLEMVSKQGEVLSVPMRVPLDQPVVRIGTHPSCECVVRLADDVVGESVKIAPVHCLLYCSMSSINTPSHHGAGSGGESKDNHGAKLKSSAASTTTNTPATSGTAATAAGDNDTNVTLVDNSSPWGTYVVSSRGTRKVPAKITAGVVLSPGLLLCLGVRRDGPQELSSTEANGACVVYRVRCLEKEG